MQAIARAVKGLRGGLLPPVFEGGHATMEGVLYLGRHRSDRGRET